MTISEQITSLENKLHKLRRAREKEIINSDYSIKAKLYSLEEEAGYEYSSYCTGITQVINSTQKENRDLGNRLSRIWDSWLDGSERYQDFSYIEALEHFQEELSDDTAYKLFESKLFEEAVRSREFGFKFDW
jgi:hypothetical protein